MRGLTPRIYPQAKQGFSCNVWSGKLLREGWVKIATLFCGLLSLSVWLCCGVLIALVENPWCLLQHPLVMPILLWFQRRELGENFIHCFGENITWWCKADFTCMKIEIIISLRFIIADSRLHSSLSVEITKLEQLMLCMVGRSIPFFDCWSLYLPRVC